MYKVTDRDGLKHKRKTYHEDKKWCIENERRRERLSPAFAVGEDDATIEKLKEGLSVAMGLAEARLKVLAEVRRALKTPDGESVITRAISILRDLERAEERLEERAEDVGP